MRDHLGVSLVWETEIPSTWRLARFGSVVSEVRDPNVNGTWRNRLSLSYGRMIPRDIDSSDGLLPESFNTYNRVVPDDLILRLTDLQNDKRSLRTALTQEAGIVTSAYVSIRPQAIEPRFLGYYLRAADLAKVFYSMGGGLRQSIGFSDLKAMRLPLPPARVQRAIADYLDHETAEIDAFIADLQQAEGLIDEHWKASLIGFIQRGLDESAELIDTGMATWPQAPKVWASTRLKNTVQHSRNGSWGSEPFEDEATVRCIRVADFDKGNSKIHDLNPTQRAYPSTVIEAQGLAAGDLLIEKSGGGPTTPVGNVVKYEGSGGEMYSNFTARMVVPAGVHPQYAIYLHKSLYLSGLTSRSVKQSTGIQNLDMTQYLNEEIYLPPLKVQAAIAERIEGERIQTENLRKDIQSALDLAGERRAALISAAVTGQIDVTKKRRSVVEQLEDEVLERV